ncbi:MAG: hypothetical protein ABW152_16630 [Candidatus Thiodiazotropha endolucinida]
MNSTIFILDSPHFEQVNKQFQTFDEIYRIPTLPAYAILNHKLDYRNNSVDWIQESIVCTIKDDIVRISGTEHGPSQIFNSHCSLTIFYAGITDYSLLFPFIIDEDLKIRLGQFAEEADKAFQNSSWMSFTVMAISAIEGILYNLFGRNDLHKLINKAEAKNLITSNEKELLLEAKNTRNRIHADNYKEPFPTRKLGTNLYVLYDRLIKKDWSMFDKDNTT